MRSQLLFLNSESATTYNNGSNNSDVTFQLRNPVIVPFDQTMSVKLTQFIFHNSIPVVNSSNNKLDIEIGLVEFNVTIPNGNYDVDTLATEVESVLNGLYPSTDPVTVTYSTDTGKYTITNTEDDFTLLSSSTCLSLLGFTEDATSVSGSLVGDFPVNMSGQDCLYFKVPSLAVANLDSTGQRTPAIGCIPVSQPSGGSIFYEDLSASKFEVNQKSVHEINVNITHNDMSTLADFQGQRWSATVELSFSLT